MRKSDFAIVGAGLAGCECALVLASAGYEVTLFEQKPLHKSPAHVSDNLAELVCSNSFRSNDPSSGAGLLKEELRALKSPFIAAADSCSIPADKALAVDREAFSKNMTAAIRENPRIVLRELRVDSLADPETRAAGPLGVVIAAGPMAASRLADDLAAVTGGENCYFYDAIAPVVWTDSLDMGIVFRASRYAEETAARGEGDYLNCPMNRAEYEAFHAALCGGETFQAREFEEETHFEGCMPVEALASRGQKVLSFGPLKPVGLIDPRTGRRPWAVLQLRPENINADTCNLVGCQTKLLQGEQKRIFRLVPGLEKVEFARYGSMHRNTYVNAPQVLEQDLSLKKMPGVYLAGQITGVEGYVESAACGHWLGRLLAARGRGNALPMPPRESALGALLSHLSQPAKRFQPSNITFGLMPELGEKAPKRQRKQMYLERARRMFARWLGEIGPTF